MSYLNETPENTRLTSVTLVTAWFGDWKGWINLWGASCASNSTIQWVLLHDKKCLPAFQPPNVRFVHTSLQECEQRIRRCIQRDIHLRAPYELCDFKPLLGQAFAEFVPGGEWYGYCDSDLLWGNVRKFLSEEILGCHDVITTHVCTIAGQCSLFRTSALAVRLFMEIDDLEEELARGGYKGLDELKIDRAASRAESSGLRVLRAMWQPWERLYDPSWESWASQLESRRQGKTVNFSIPTGPCEWRNGEIRLLPTGEEFMFFHFLEWKRQMDYPEIPWPLPDLESIQITPQGLKPGWRDRTIRNNAAWYARIWVHQKLAKPLIWRLGQAIRFFRKVRRCLSGTSL